MSFPRKGSEYLFKKNIQLILRMHFYLDLQVPTDLVKVCLECLTFSLLCSLLLQLQKILRTWWILHMKDPELYCALKDHSENFVLKEKSHLFLSELTPFKPCATNICPTNTNLQRKIYRSSWFSPGSQKWQFYSIVIILWWVLAVVLKGPFH